MLNMFLAIIMDCYTSVKEELCDDDRGDGDKCPTIFQQAQKIWRRGIEKRKGNRVSLETILAALESHHEDLQIREAGKPDRTKAINVKQFMEMVPALQKA